MKQLNAVHDLNISACIGKYIIFGGYGIIDGLKSPPCKSASYKIIGLNDGGLNIKGYRRKIHSILPVGYFDQEARIYDTKEFKQFPIYST